MPPILRTPGLRLIKMGTTNRGVYFLIGSRRPKRQIAIVVHGERVFYTYTILDPETKTMVSYKGTHGDPTKDEQTDLDGLDLLDE